ncbi:MAG: hypothetical protein IS860_03665 [Nitrosopumilus sp.]|nr:hypothetical protein [Nitrosopumilus sp.]
MKTELIIVAIILISIFLIWDAFGNNGNVVWSKAYVLATFSQIEDAQWAEKYNTHPIVVAFKQKYNDVILTQDLGYTGKYLDYTVSDSSSPRLHIWIIDDKRVHFYLKCEESVKSLRITVPMQVGDFNCHDHITDDRYKKHLDENNEKNKN